MAFNVVVCKVVFFKQSVNVISIVTVLSNEGSSNGVSGRVDSENDEYIEFEITRDELTNDVALVITDFVSEKEEKESIALWDSQIHDLRNSLGA